MSENRVHELDRDDWPRWDAFVSDHPCGTLFQTTAWLGRLEGCLQILVLERERDGQLMGGLALLRNQRFHVTGYHQPALTPYMGPLVAVNPNDKEHTQRHTHQIGVQMLIGAIPKCGHIGFLLHPSQTNVLPYLWSGYSTDLGYTSFIEGGVEDYLQSMSPGLRKRLRSLQRLQEEGKVELKEARNPTELMPLLEATMRTKHFKYDMDASQALFQPEGYGSLWKAVKVQADGELLACTLVVFDAHSSYGILAGASRTGKGGLDNAQLLSYDYVIRHALESGRRFDLCGSSLPGVDSFNRRFGATLVPRIRVQKSQSLWMQTLRAGQQLKNEHRPAQIVDK